MSGPIRLDADEADLASAAQSSDGSAEAPALVPYLLETPDGSGRGAVIVCPGGGYHHLAQHEGEPVARWLNGLGIHAFVLRYRIAPHRHPAPLEDARRAIRLVRSRAGERGIRADKIGIMGGLCGAWLARLGFAAT